MEAINRGLEESGIFVLLLSPDAVASRWVNMETNAAIEFEHEGKMQFYPLLLKLCRLPALWRAFQHISFLDGYEPGIRVLINVLKPADTDSNLATGAFIVDSRTGEVSIASSPVRNQNFIDQKTGKEFVYIPAGEFLFGDEKTKMRLDEFWIAKTPVTNAEYARFVAEMKVDSPKHWQGKTPPADIANHPVVYVSWHDARAYAEWAGLELPTEEQWEKAARGTDRREYPWGNEWRENHCNTRESGIMKTTPVGQFSPQGDSPFGCVDMAGNVWEWTASEGSSGSTSRALRGGSWNLNQRYARVASRLDYNPVYANFNLGFRLVAPISSGF